MSKQDEILDSPIKGEDADKLWQNRAFLARLMAYVIFLFALDDTATWIYVQYKSYLPHGFSNFLVGAWVFCLFGVALFCMVYLVRNARGILANLDRTIESKWVMYTGSVILFVILFCNGVIYGTAKREPSFFEFAAIYFPLVALLFLFSIGTFLLLTRLRWFS